MVSTASWTVAVPGRQIGSAGPSTLIVSFRSAPLVSRTSPSSAAEYSSSNSPMALPLFPERASLQSYSPSRGESRPSARGLFVRLAQELDESAHGRRQRLLPAVDDPHGPDQSEERRVGKECRGRWAAPRVMRKLVRSRSSR